MTKEIDKLAGLSDTLPCSLNNKTQQWPPRGFHPKASSALKSTKQSCSAAFSMLFLILRRSTINCDRKVYSQIWWKGEEIIILKFTEINTVVPFSLQGIRSKTPVDAWNPREYWTLYKLHFSMHVYIPMVKFNLQIRHNRLSTNTKTKIG